MPTALRYLAFTFLALLLTTPPAVSAGSNSIVIGIDVSGSMKGAPLEEALNTTDDLVLNLGRERNIEIYTFAQIISKVTGVAALGGTEGKGYTSLYDAMWELAQEAKRLQAPLIIITDGRDSRSSLTVSELMALLADVGVRIDFITYQPRPNDLSILSSFAATTTGKVYNVDDWQSLISTLQGAVERVDEVEEVPAPTSSKRVAIFIASATGLLSLSLFQMLRRWRAKDSFLASWENVLNRYEIQSSSPKRESNDPGLFQLITSRFVGDTSLLLPNVKSEVQRQFVFVGGVGLVLVFLLIIRTPLFIAVVLAFILSLLVIRALISRAEQKARSDFENELPAAMKLIASSLTAGLSFLQALDTFSSDGTTQVAKEFRRALAEIQMGAPLERAFGDVAERMTNEDLKWVVFAFSVQREVGGSLAKILQTSAETIESRANLRQEIKTLSAEGRISSYILILLPPAIFTFLALTRPSFIALFWQEAIGHLLLALIVILMSLSWVWMRRLIRIES